MNARDADPEGPVTRSAVTTLIAHVAASSEDFRTRLLPSGIVDALCRVCVSYSEGGAASESVKAVKAAAVVIRELAKSTELRPALRDKLNVRALVETARYVHSLPKADPRDAEVRTEARKWALITIHALADPEKNDDAGSFRARLFAGDGGTRDGLSALMSCLEASDADVAIELKEHACKCVADLAFDEDRKDAVLSRSATLLSIVRNHRTPSLKLKASAACALLRATAASAGGTDTIGGNEGTGGEASVVNVTFTADDFERTARRVASLAAADGVLEGLCRMLRKPTKEETKPPPTAAELAALEEERVRAAELAEFERLEREAAAEEPGAGAEAEVKPEAADTKAKPDEPTRDATETGAGAADDADKDEEDEDDDDDDEDGGGGDETPAGDGGGGGEPKKKAKKKKAAGKKKKKGGGKKKGPTPGLLDGYVAAVALIRRMCFDDVRIQRRLHTLGAHLHLAKLRGHEDARVRVSADAALRAMGGEPLAAAEMAATEGAPAWHTRLNLPGVSLEELDEMDASARMKLEAMMPGVRID